MANLIQLISYLSKFNLYVHEIMYVNIFLKHMTVDSPIFITSWIYQMIAVLTGSPMDKLLE